jgi:hypothetical protein
MNRSLVIIFLVVSASLATIGSLAQAQIITPGGSPLIAPLPPPPPPPKIEAPVVPKLDELPTRNYVPAPRPSFSDKITTCLEEGAAAGLAPADRAAYSAGCANSR